MPLHARELRRSGPEVFFHSTLAPISLQGDRVPSSDIRLLPKLGSTSSELWSSRLLVRQPLLLSMWYLASVKSSFKLWFSDGMPIDDVRGGRGVSCRLIVDQKGFLDLTEYPPTSGAVLDANGLSLRPPAGLASPRCWNSNRLQCIPLGLEIRENGHFRISAAGSRALPRGTGKIASEDV